MRKTLFFILIPAMLTAQIPKQEMRQAKQEFREQQRQDWDVTLDPVQRVITAEVNPANLANWGYVWTKARAVEGIVQQRARRTVRVYVFDTAGKLDHPDLGKPGKAGKVFTGESSEDDGHGHGTHVAGTIGAGGRYELGIGRVLTEIEKLEIVPVKVLNNQGSALYSWITNAANWALADADQHRGKFIIWNFSLGGGGGDAGLTDAFARARAKGILILAAAGNSSRPGVGFPARDVSARAIAALQQNGAGVEKAPYSSWGPEVYLAAPGSNIMSTLPGGGYGAMSGTSMATPTAAGLFAVLAACNPGCSAGDLLKAVEAYAQDLPPAGRDELHGFGALQLDKILEKELCQGESPVDPDSDPEPEPPKPDPKPDPVKTPRWVSVYIPDTFTLTWRAQNSLEYRKTLVSFRVSVWTEKTADKAAQELADAVRLYHTNRGYVLLPDADDVDAGYWAAHFMELLFPRMTPALKINVDAVNVYLSGALSAYLADPIPNKSVTWKATRKAGTLTVNYDTGGVELIK